MLSTDEVSRIVLVQLDADSPYERCHVTQVKHFVEGQESATSFQRDVHHALSQFSPTSRETNTTENRHVDNDATRQVAVSEEDSMSLRQIAQLIHMEGEVAFKTYTTEVIEACDPRAQSELMNDAIKVEVTNLIERGTFTVLKTNDLPDLLW